MHFSDSFLVENWLFMLRKLFRNPKKNLYGYRRRYKSIAKYWLHYGKHDTDSGDSIIAIGQKMWDEYLEMFIKSEEGDYRAWILAHYKQLSYL